MCAVVSCNMALSDLRYQIYARDEIVLITTVPPTVTEITPNQPNKFLLGES